MFGLDFRNLRMLERWCDLISERYPRLDAIVNNACQTIRRPPAYYAHLLPLECANPGSHIYRQALGSSAAGGMLSHNDASLSALIGSSAAVDIDFSADNGGLSSALNAQFSSVSRFWFNSARLVYVGCRWRDCKRSGLVPSTDNDV
jgi:hypothetical protein